MKRHEQGSNQQKDVTFSSSVLSGFSVVKDYASRTILCSGHGFCAVSIRRSISSAPYFA